MVDFGYCPFDTRTVCDFVQPLVREPVVSAEEIGDGNLNLVFRVTARSGRSVIVKQALPYLRVAGEAWSLTRHRARIEADAIEAHGKLAPEMLPRLIHFDETLSALVLEDLAGHVTWREALMSGRATPGVAAAVGRYCAQVLLGTSDVKLSSPDRKALRRRFVYSELCIVTEDLVFTSPYIDSPSNRYDPAISILAESLRADPALHKAAAELRFAFKTRDEALLHGDLHTGSVMVKDDDVRVIDLEFAYFGPVGFDPGLLLAHLALARIAHEASGGESYARLIDGYAFEFWDALSDESRRRWSPTEPWFDRFFARVLADAARFAGLEMIRRIVGLAHAQDVDCLSPTNRLQAQNRVVSAGRSLVLGSPCAGFAELWNRATHEEHYA